MNSFFSVVLFVMAISLSVCNSIANSTQTPINPNLYHSSVDLLDQIKALVHRHGDKLTLETFRAGNKGYKAEINVVTYCRSISESDDKSKFRILLSFGQHGRELITTKLAYRILSILSEEQYLPNLDSASLNSTLDKLIIKDYDPYEENPGTGPFSELESQIMRKIALSFDPHIWVNVHSGMEALFMPYDHKNTSPDGLPCERMRSLLNKVNKAHCHERCMIG